MTGWTTGNGQNSMGRSFPFGPLGVGVLTAGLGALAGLLIPMAWIEEVSWQLYLDQLIAAARPPLGVTARLAALVALAILLGLLGWLVAKMTRVHSHARDISHWFAGLRGTQADDEPDAPVLRSADRHPDAPARRPFSAARDVPVEDDDRTDAPWVVDEDAHDELLLDAHFDESVAVVAADEESRAARWASLEQVDAADEEPAMPVSSLTAHPPEPTAPAVAPAPLDLSIAKLDELIARLEAGLARREAAPAPEPAALATMATEPALPVGNAEPVIARGGEPAPAEPSFPQDPALAAALATLRRMNRST